MSIAVSSKPVLDLFHISMRVRYLEQIIKGMRARTETEKAARLVLISRVDKLRWCFWHAKLEKAKTRMQGILILCRVIVSETPGIAESLAQLDYRTRELVEYVEANGGSTMNYCARHRCGKPISTATAESAVNQVLNQRVCKRQQMRWSPIGAHLLAQVRCAVINGDLAERLARYEPPRKPLSRCVDFPGESIKARRTSHPAHATYSRNLNARNAARSRGVRARYVAGPSHSYLHCVGPKQCN